MGWMGRKSDNLKTGMFCQDCESADCDCPDCEACNKGWKDPNREKRDRIEDRSEQFRSAAQGVILFRTAAAINMSNLRPRNDLTEEEIERSLPADLVRAARKSERKVPIL